MNEFPASRKPSLASIGAMSVLGAVAACSNHPAASSGVATASAGESDSAQSGDPLANDARLRALVVANGIITARNACDLLSRADAEAAVGQALPKSTVNVTLGMCDYTTADFSAGASLTVGNWESMKAAATSGKAIPASIAGVGDEALNLNGSTGSNLYVRRGDEGFLLDLNGPKIDSLADHGLAQEQALALKILSKF